MRQFKTKPGPVKLENPSPKTAYMREYWKSNPEKYVEWLKRQTELRRERRVANPEITKQAGTYVKRKYATDPVFRARAIADSKNAYVKMRNKILEAYGYRCNCCGETEELFLEIDHVNGGGSAHFKRMKSPGTLYREIIRDGFPDAYRILCANCNKGRMRNGGICPHERDVKKAMGF